MKKLFIAGILSAFLLAGCGNSDPLGGQYYFGWAQIKLPNVCLFSEKPAD